MLKIYPTTNLLRFHAKDSRTLGIVRQCSALISSPVLQATLPSAPMTVPWGRGWRQEDRWVPEEMGGLEPHGWETGTAEKWWGSVSGTRRLEKTREPAQKVAVLRTSVWQKKRLLLSQTSSVRIIDNQEQEEKQIRRPFPRLKVIQIPFHRGDNMQSVWHFQKLDTRF